MPEIPAPPPPAGLATGLHPGEYRCVTMRPTARRYPGGEMINTFCNRDDEDEDTTAGEGMFCNHVVAVIKHDHWSCCALLPP